MVDKKPPNPLGTEEENLGINPMKNLLKLEEET